MPCRLAGSRVFPPLESLGEQQPLWESLVTLSGQGPCEQKPSLANCRFHTLAPGFLEGFSIRHPSICAVNAVVPDDPQRDLVVCRPELSIVSVTRGPRHAPVQQSFHGLRLQQPSLEPQWRVWPVEELCGELPKTSPSDFGAATYCCYIIVGRLFEKLWEPFLCIMCVVCAYCCNLSFSRECTSRKDRRRPHRNCAVSVCLQGVTISRLLSEDTRQRCVDRWLHLRPVYLIATIYRSVELVLIYIYIPWV